MSDKLEPRFNPETIRESVRHPMEPLEDDEGPDEQLPQRRGSGLLLNLVLLILVLALGGMGWLLLEQRQALDESQQRLSVLESRLAVNQDTIERSGDTLQEQLAALQEAQVADRAASQSRLDELLQRVEQEVAQREKLEKQQQENLAQLQTLSTSLAGVSEPLTELERLQGEMTALQQQVAQLSDLARTDDTANNVSAEELQQLVSQVSSLTERQQQSARQLSEFGTQLTAAQQQYQSLESDIRRQFSTLEAKLVAEDTATGPDELAMIEISMAELREDIRAINNARQLINRDLLQLREQLNRLQLQLN